MSETGANSRVRVLLVNTNQYEQPYPVYPLSLAYLSAALRAADHDYLCWDAKFSEQSLTDAVLAYKPDYIGISVRNIDNVQSHNPRSFIRELIDCCRTLRQVSGAVLVLGGSGFSVFPKELLAVAGADYGIAGEGERALVDLIEARRKGADERLIPGLVWKEKEGQIGMASRMPGEYRFTVSPLHDEALLKAYASKGSIPGLQTQRGCPLRCCYCTYPLIEGRNSRYRTGEEVVEEMRRMLALGVRYTFIVDSVFNTRSEHVQQVCEALIHANLGMEWGCFLRPRNLNRGTLELMKRAGLKHVEFGSDSLSDKVLGTYNKSFTWEEIRQASELAHNLKINYSHFLIFGGPGETTETVEETLARSKLLHGSYFFATIGMRIYPNTPLWDHCAPEKQGRSAADYLLEPHFYLEAPLSTSLLSDRLKKHLAECDNWVLGDPPPLFAETMEKLRKRGVVGPMWEYVELLQRMARKGAAAQATRSSSPCLTALIFRTSNPLGLPL